MVASTLMVNRPDVIKWGKTFGNPEPATLARNSWSMLSILNCKLVPSVIPEDFKKMLSVYSPASPSGMIISDESTSSVSLVFEINDDLIGISPLAPFSRTPAIMLFHCEISGIGLVKATRFTYVGNPSPEPMSSTTNLSTSTALDGVVEVDKISPDGICSIG